MIHKNKGIYYFEKVYLNYENQKVIKFVKIMRHILQLLAFKKKIFYKNPNEYDVDDINKVKYIQRNYLNHYYNNKPISLRNIKNNLDTNNNIKSSSYITKEKINNVMNKLLLIQGMIKLFISKRKSIKSQINKNT